LPSWLVDERGPAAAAIAQVAVRRAVLPEHPLAFDEPTPGTRAAVAWPAILSSALPLAGQAGLIVRSVYGEAVGEAVAATRAAASAAGEASGSLGPLRPRGPSLTMARGTVTAAVATLERIAASGWPSILGEAVRPSGRGRLGADMVVERTESFDALASAEENHR
jgi:hypothetical protein